MTWGKRLKPSIAQRVNDPKLNPLGLSYSTVAYRIREAGLTPEQALSQKTIKGPSLREFFNSHPNPHKLSFWAFKKRVEKIGLSRAEAMETSREDMQRIGIQKQKESREKNKSWRKHLKS